MSEKITTADTLLETEAGRFLLELEAGHHNIQLLVEASDVPEEIKVIYKNIVEELINDLHNCPNLDRETTFAFSRGAVAHLLDTVDRKDKEQHHLFETVRNAIYRAENSAVGFRSDYLQA
ncbi:MAG: hypothetical protein V4690_01340 [Patescibacteria group bacterium]